MQVGVHLFVAAPDFSLRHMPLQECPSQLCGSGHRCLPLSKLCDTRVDCLNAQDETFCRDNNFLETSTKASTPMTSESLCHLKGNSFCNFQDQNDQDKLFKLSKNDADKYLSSPLKSESKFPKNNTHTMVSTSYDYKTTTDASSSGKISVMNTTLIISTPSIETTELIEHFNDYTVDSYTSTNEAIMDTTARLNNDDILLPETNTFTDVSKTNNFSPSEVFGSVSEYSTTTEMDYTFMTKPFVEITLPSDSEHKCSETNTPTDEPNSYVTHTVENSNLFSTNNSSTKEVHTEKSNKTVFTKSEELTFEEHHNHSYSTFTHSVESISKTNTSNLYNEISHQVTIIPKQEVQFESRTYQGNHNTVQNVSTTHQASIFLNNHLEYSFSKDVSNNTILVIKGTNTSSNSKDREIQSMDVEGRKLNKKTIKQILYEQTVYNETESRKGSVKGGSEIEKITSVCANISTSSPSSQGTTLFICKM